MLQIRAGDTRYTIAPDGTLDSAATDDGRQLTRPAPLVSVKVGGRWFRVTAFSQHGRTYQADFRGSGVTADYAVDAGHGAIVLRLVKLSGRTPDEIQLAHLVAPELGRPGSRLALRSNDKRVIALVPLDDCVNARLERPDSISASVYPSFGMTGHAVAIASAPRSRFLALMRDIELAYGLPSPTLDGVWAKQSPTAHAGYLFTDLTEGNVDQTIRYAKLANFKYILVYATTWASSLGSYPINRTAYPHGEAGLKATIARVHAAGLRVGMHMLSSLVSKNDPLVRPVPDPRLLKDAEAKLAADVGPSSKTIETEEPLVGFPHGRAYYGPAKAGLDIQIDDEILQCPGVGVAGPRTFSGCKRGFAGTRPAPHRAGSRIQHLAERFGSYLVDLKTSLKEQVAERVARLIDRDGFDMVYFDGGDADAADGPAWHWVGQEQFAIWHRVHHSLFVSGSGITPFSWHFYTRANGGDYVAIEKRRYFAGVTLKRWLSWQDSFTLSDLGWWGLLDRTASHRATTPGDAEFLATKMLALDAPISVQTSMARLRGNGRTDQILQTLGRWGRLQKSGLVPDSLRATLRSGSWRLETESGKVAFYPVHRMRSRTTSGDAVRVQNAGPAQPYRFRLRCLPKVAAAAAGNLTLFRPARPLTLLPPKRSAPMPGALAGALKLGIASTGEETSALPGVASAGSRRRVGLDLSNHRGLAITLEVSGPPGPASAPPGILDFQLESTSKRYRDYPVSLDFRGRRTIEIPAPNAAQFVADLRPSPRTYNFRAALSSFTYGSVVALNVRWMRHASATTKVSILSVSALKEAPDVTGSVTLRLGGAQLTVLHQLHSGDYIEYMGGDSLQIFDADGHLLSTVAVPKPIRLQSGANRIRVEAAAGRRFELSSFVFGTPRTLAVPPGAVPDL